MTKAISGIMHLHTKYSYDGTVSLREVAKTAKKRGFSFLLLTEHSNHFDAQKMARLIADCRAFSTEEFVIISGLEVDCDFGRHILAIGIKQYIGTGDPARVVEAIRENGGLAVLAHPALYQFRSFLPSAAKLNGVEVWNSRYDGKYAPNPKSFTMLKSLQNENPRIFAYGGQDLHSAKEFDPLCLTLDASTVSERDVLQCLEAGRFKVVRKRTTIDASGEISSAQRLLFDIVNSGYMLGRALRSSLREAP